MPRLGGFLQFFLQLGFAFVQCLQTQLPAMQLDRQLIDVTSNFGVLRFVFGQATLDLIEPDLRTRRRSF